MTRTSVDLVTDVGLAGGDLTGVNDVTNALVGGATSADGLCRQYGVKKVTMPNNCKLLVSVPADPVNGTAALTPKYARDWVGDMGSQNHDDGTQIVLDVVSQKQW